MNEPETLLLDIGTNGEMVLGKADHIKGATAAGPALREPRLWECRQQMVPFQKSDA